MSRAIPTQHENLQELCTGPPLYKFNIDEYEMMGTAGIFGEDDRVELIEGEILRMGPIGLRHMSVLNRLNMLYSLTLGKSAIVSVQNPIVVNRYSEPQPDVVVLKYRDDFYDKAKPRPQDILLVIEVAETSAHYDRTLKKSIYAANGINELWVVDVARGQVEQYMNLDAADYRTMSVLKRGQKVCPATMPEIEFEILEILGPEERAPA